jgi:hypothetical protein
LAVSDRVTALGGCRNLCGRALCRQSPSRRDSALEVVPRLSIEGREHSTVRRRRSRDSLGPKFFYCAPQYKVLISCAFPGALTYRKALISIGILET